MVFQPQCGNALFNGCAVFAIADKDQFKGRKVFDQRRHRFHQKRLRLGRTEPTHTDDARIFRWRGQREFVQINPAAHNMHLVRTVTACGGQDHTTRVIGDCGDKGRMFHFHRQAVCGGIVKLIRSVGRETVAGPTHPARQQGHSRRIGREMRMHVMDAFGFGGLFEEHGLDHIGHVPDTGAAGPRGQMQHCFCRTRKAERICNHLGQGAPCKRQGTLFEDIGCLANLVAVTRIDRNFRPVADRKAGDRHASRLVRVDFAPHKCGGRDRVGVHQIGDAHVRAALADRPRTLSWHSDPPARSVPRR